jgi:predicted nucleic acid-binding protein
MAVVYQEDGAQQVQDLLSGGETILLPFIALMEVHYKVLQDRPEAVDDALAMLRDWQTETVESNEQWREVAALVKSRGKLSVADAWVASLALIHDAVLVHKDPEFDEVPGLQHERLPYRAAAG